MFTLSLRRAAPFITAAALIFPAVAPAAAQHAKPPAHAKAAKRAKVKRARAAAAHKRAVGHSLMSSTDLWATVNICDTPKNPNAIGIRASMPGTGAPGEMFVRFRVQYYIPDNDSWSFVQHGGDSHWLSLGHGGSTRQSGFTFAYVPPPTGVYTMRGVVDYQWRVDGKAVYSTQQGTHKGHSDADLGDPDGYSAGLCTIRK